MIEKFWHWSLPSLQARKDKSCWSDSSSLLSVKVFCYTKHNASIKWDFFFYVNETEDRKTFWNNFLKITLIIFVYY